MDVVEEVRTNVEVAVRIRAVSEEERARKESACVDAVEDSSQIVCGTKHSFTFDHTFAGSSNQRSIYDACVSPLVDCLFGGFNATILAYGQTGSGKTYTMGSESVPLGTAESTGIIPRVITDVFSRVEREHALVDGMRRYAVKVQFLEIYGDDVKDLLAQDRRASNLVSIREQAGGETLLHGASEVEVQSASAMMKVLEEGSRLRTTGATNMNLTSSRSHAIFTVMLETSISLPGAAVADEDGVTSGDDSAAGTPTPPDLPPPPSPTQAASSSSVPSDALTPSLSQPETRKCKFHFVDLAGSERQKRTGAEGHQLKEGIDINKGLLALGNVISALGDEQKRGLVHVPYRDSKLTRMLQDSLGGNSKTLMICCVSPGDNNFYESLSALRYANRARNIKNRPVVNRDPTSTMIHELRSQVSALASELLRYRDSSGAVPAASLEPGLAGTVAGTSFPADVLRALEVQASHAHVKRRGSDDRNSRSTGASTSKQTSSSNKESKEAVQRAEEAEAEVLRLTKKLKQSQQHMSELNDRLVLMHGERDFFKLKWSDAEPAQASAMAAGSAALSAEKESITASTRQYLTEIADLKSELGAVQRCNGRLGLRLSAAGGTVGALGGMGVFDSESDGTGLAGGHKMPDGELQHIEAELTLNIAKVISQTQEQLRRDEARMLGLGGERRAIENGAGVGSVGGESGEGSGGVEGEEIKEENNYQWRQRLVTKEMEQLSDSIMMKEKLVGQLQKSQGHYDNMKDFFGQRLDTLEQEMAEKEAERDRLNRELQELEERAEVATQKKAERLGDLRAQLKQRDEELKGLRRRQTEMQHLNDMQNRYATQLAKLGEDIVEMKKKKVELRKTQSAEKRRHMTALNEKMREIERLKRSLTVMHMNNAKLGMDRQQALREKIVLMKRVSEAEAVSQNRTRRLMGRVVDSKAPMFSERDLKTKGLLDKKLAAITIKEEMVDNLRKQCEQQLRLLDAKSRLEEERGGLRDLIANMYDGTDSDGSLRGEEEDAMREIEERMESLEGQLYVRKERIEGLQSSLRGDEEDPREAAMETLKAVPATQDILRLLFEMLVSARRDGKGARDQLRGEKARYISLREELAVVTERLNDSTRAVNVEGTNARMEYEDKLFALYERCAVVQQGAGRDDRSSNDAAKSLNIMLAINKEQQVSLHSVARERQTRIRQLERDVDESHALAQTLRDDVEEARAYNKFLEDERDFFREMADDLKSGITGLEGDLGQHIIRQIVLKERIDAQGRDCGGGESPPPTGGAGTLSQLPSREPVEVSTEDDRDSESLLGDFSDLSFQIEQTGSAAAAGGTPGGAPESGAGTAGAAKSTERERERASMDRGRVVFDRLTNPSNFTGRAKNIFRTDVADKRQKVLLIKRGDGPSRDAVGPRDREPQGAQGPSGRWTPLRGNRSGRDKSAYLGVVGTGVCTGTGAGVGAEFSDGFRAVDAPPPSLPEGGRDSSDSYVDEEDSMDHLFTRLHNTGLRRQRRSASTGELPPPSPSN